MPVSNQTALSQCPHKSPSYSRGLDLLSNTDCRTIKPLPLCGRLAAPNRIPDIGLFEAGINVEVIKEASEEFLWVPAKLLIGQNMQVVRGEIFAKSREIAPVQTVLS